MTESDALSFPDAPRSDLDLAIASLLEQGERVMRTQERLRALLHASQTVVEPIELHLVLRRVVEAAVELVDAEYGAIGVISAERDGLEQFVYVGVSDEDAAAIGHVPEGRGLLGALIDDPRPIRLAEMSSDPRAVGFPDRHPRMTTFLGVPVWVRGEVFGNLYLANRREGEFTEEDEQLVSALAATAGFAIDNARLFRDSEARERWSAAAAELTSALLSTPNDRALDLLAGRLLEVASARRTFILLTAAEDVPLRIAASAGAVETPLGPLRGKPEALVAEVLRNGMPHANRHRSVSDDLGVLSMTRGRDSGPALAVPLRNRSGIWGIAVIERDVDAPSFSATEVESATDLASRASIALELERAREDAQRAMLAADRARIARDLHDHVIQQLFGAGLALQSVGGRVGAGREADIIADVIRQLDDAVTQIRTVVFALSHRDDSSLRHRLLDIVGELSVGDRTPPTIRFTGPVDHLVHDELATDVVAVVRELLANALRHAAADRITIDVAVDGTQVSVRVTDDGKGFPEDAARRGLRNLEERAQARGGSFTVVSDAGTSARWTAPLDPLDPGEAP